MTKPLFDVVVVMPVYNEEGAIETVIDSWQRELSAMNLNYMFHAYNDGSKDGTLAILNRLAEKYPRLKVHDQKNKGHGPTVLAAYKNNLDTEWLFQIDSDDEVKASSFKEFWQKKDGYDFIIGRRTNRNVPAVRKMVTWMAATLNAIFYGPGVGDTNCPFRLMRVATFKRAILALPADIVSPNVVLSGVAPMMKYRILQIDIPFEYRKTGVGSYQKWRLVKVTLKSMVESIALRFELNKKLR